MTEGFIGYGAGDGDGRYLRDNSRCLGGGLLRRLVGSLVGRLALTDADRAVDGLAAALPHARRLLALDLKVLVHEPLDVHEARLLERLLRLLVLVHRLAADVVAVQLVDRVDAEQHFRREDHRRARQILQIDDLVLFQQIQIVAFVQYEKIIYKMNKY